MEEKILTWHPQGKQGTNISKTKYDQVTVTIVSALETQGELTFMELNMAVGRQLANNTETDFLVTKRPFSGIVLQET